MKKILILAVGLMMLMSLSSFASETRTMVMGENNMIMVDDYNMFMFPGRVNNYPNLVLGEFDYDSDELYDFGVTWQFNDDNPWVLGTFVSTEPEFGPENFWGSDIANFVVDIEDEPRRFQMLYGRQLAGYNFGFGLEAVRFGYEYEDTSWTEEVSFSQYTFTLGLTEATSGQWDVALQFMTGSWTNEEDGEKISEPSGFSDIGLAGRYFMVRNPKVTMVPHLSVMISKRGFEHYQGTPADNTDDRIREWTSTDFELGMGFNYTPAPKVLAVFDIGLQYSKVKEERSGGYYTADQQGEYTDSWTSIPYFKIGFEGEVLSWMDIRAGGTTHLWSSKYKYEDKVGETSEETYNEGDTDTYFGFGFHWGNLYIDTYTDPEIVLDGFNFISGSEDVEDLNWKVSMTYEMF
ncbi:MAG: hypothetical protein J7J98_05925 [candidate division Zixibacteria bacterium]|nr:hypothetical protein [candidate division Zixibacteria bacterium]